MRCADATLKAVLRGEWQLLPIETQIAWRDAAARHLLNHLHRLSLTRRGQALNEKERVLYPEQINGMKAWIHHVCTNEIVGMTELERLLEDEYARSSSVNTIEQSEMKPNQGQVDATCKG